MNWSFISLHSDMDLNIKKIKKALDILHSQIMHKIKLIIKINLTKLMFVSMATYIWMSLLLSQKMCSWVILVLSVVDMCSSAVRANLVPPHSMLAILCKRLHLPHASVRPLSVICNSVLVPFLLISNWNVNGGLTT